VYVPDFGYNVGFS